MRQAKPFAVAEGHFVSLRASGPAIRFVQGNGRLGKIGGVGTNTVTARAAITDAKVRVTATLDAQGNRTGVAVDLD